MVTEMWNCYHIELSEFNLFMRRQLAVLSNPVCMFEYKG